MKTSFIALNILFKLYCNQRKNVEIVHLGYAMVCDANRKRQYGTVHALPDIKEFQLHRYYTAQCATNR